MIDVQDKKKCCACSACYSVCPVNAIKMIEDEKGFKYPKVDMEKCINCSLCEKVCPIINEKSIENNQKAYACYNKDEYTRIQSTSGGIFTLLAKKIIQKGGVVFGASFGQEFNIVEHSYSENIKETAKFRGSKYLQSDIGDSYKKVKEFLMKERYVLFTGTPCQIEGLKNYLGKEYAKLYLQDIVCHGVPSPKIWREYKNYRSNNSKLTEMSFRSKKEEGWSKYHISMKFENGKKYNTRHDKDTYIMAFLSHLALRESCTDCRFKKKNRVSDITLGDFWGINGINPKMNDEKGTSLVVINSLKGQELFNSIKDEIIYEEVNFENAIKENPSYIYSSKTNIKSEQFFMDINNNNFDKVVNRYIKNEKKYIKILRKIKQIVKNIKWNM